MVEKTSQQAERHDSRNRKLAGHIRHIQEAESEQEVGQSSKVSNPCDVLPPARFHPLTVLYFPRQHHQLGTKYLNT